MSSKGIDRRLFLKSAAASAAAIIGTNLAANSASAQTTKPGAEAKDTELSGERVIGRPGSDFMVDVIKSTGIEYVAANPGSSFRSLHESIVNYGGNRKPEFLTCTHEEVSVAIAHGYAKAAGKPIGILAHSTVGLQHAVMAVYNAWCDRVPVIMFAGNSLDADKRRPGVEWYHCVQDPAALLRDFIKWDDQPASLQHFAESVVRSYKLATMSPFGPVLITADTELQEEPVHEAGNLRIPKLTFSIPPQGDSSALSEVAKMLVAAERPLVIADRAARSQEGVTRLVEVAEALNAPVIDVGSRMNFPTTHYLCQTQNRGALVREADLVLLLEVADPWGQFNSVGDPYKEYRRLAKPDVKVIHISLGESLTKSNYQDMQRYMPVDLAISGDVEATLPALTEAVRSATGSGRRAALADRTEKLRAQYRQTRERTSALASYGWDARPVTTARLAAELWNAIKNEKWCLTATDGVTWARRLWPATQYYNFLGHAGGAGVGYTASAAVGAALANRDKGIVTVTFQPDGDLLYAPGVLWTAAHHKIPILMLMHNNRAYHQEVMHLQRMAGLHNRRMDTAYVGTSIDKPNVDFAKLAQSMGVWAEGPITDPAAIGRSLSRAIAVVKRGEPALIDVVTQGR